MKIYTKKGDKGLTSLYNGEQIGKKDGIIDTLGHFDELSAALGLAKSMIEDASMKDHITHIQKDLMVLMGELANHGPSKGRINEEKVKWLEEAIDTYQEKYIQSKEFSLAGDNQISASLDLARTIARRAERSLYREKESIQPSITIQQYANRLSDFIYTLARYMDFITHVERIVKNNLSDKVAEKRFVNALGLETALALIKKVQQKAEEKGLAVVVAVVNDAGHPIAVHCMDHALIASYELAVNKAFTCAAVKMSTEKLGELAGPGQSLYGIQFSNGGKIVTFGGGVPLYRESKIIGAIGVSGGTAEQDSMLAKYGAKLIEECSI